MNSFSFPEAMDYHGVPPVVAKAYLKYLYAHIGHVQDAGRRLLVPEAQLRVHDQSKFTPEQFYGYAMHFFGGGAPDAFAYAWLFHQNTERHHWEFYITRTDHTDGGGGSERGIMQMPRSYAAEMVADWQGASLAKTGSANMRDWLTANIPRIRVHSKTAVVLREILTLLGYGELVQNTKFATESNLLIDIL